MPAVIAPLLAALLALPSAPAPVDFAREVRPILADHCLSCHGPDEARREAFLRLDVREEALAERAEGAFAIVPGDPARSLVAEKIASADPKEVMPPPSAKNPLAPEEIALLRRWIEEGAAWPEHWAFVAPARPPVPPLPEGGNAVDAFLAERLAREGLAFSPEASKESLVRRATFDLTGLPPTVAEIDAFLADEAPGAYERVVDRLLASPRFGERMAVHWLDLARYADTNGYHIDNHRDMWKWRDWVIAAFNEGKPFDRFAIEQLAGDLLPNATLEQKVASGFNRNHPINFEGGADPDEYQTKYVVDRVVTTAEVFMGLTMACAECHDHKYDPISQREFYSFYAYFNNVPEQGLDGQKTNPLPSLKVPTDAEAADLARRDAEIEAIRAFLAGPVPSMDAEQPEWEARERERLGPPVEWTPIAPTGLLSRNGATLALADDLSLLASGANPAADVYEITTIPPRGVLAAIRLEALTDASLPHGGAARSENGNFVLTGFEAEIVPIANPTAAASVAFSGAAADHFQGAAADVMPAGGNFRVENAIDADPASGWAVEGFNRREPREATFAPAEPVPLDGESVLRVRLRFESPFPRHSIGRFRLATTSDPRVPESLAPPLASHWKVLGPFAAASGEAAFATDFGPESQSAEADALAWREKPEWKDGGRHELDGDSSATYVARTITSARERDVALLVGSDDTLKIWLNGALVHEHASVRGAAPDQDRVVVRLRPGENRLLMKIVNHAGGYAFYFRVDPRTDDPRSRSIDGALRSLVRTEEEARAIRDRFRSTVSEEGRRLHADLAAKSKARDALLAAIPETMVMDERPERRTTHVLVRGNFQVKGDPVEPGVPACLPPLPEGEPPASRLTLAKWLFSDAHPLTARVTVNRLWQLVFGRGLVATPEDFGLRAALPSHPELLDWLAVEFRESGWDVKALLRTLVTSRAYRQSASVSASLLERDPENVLLARGPRVRLDAEMVRDAALAASGLLSPESSIGGRSVRPYQPAGLWEAVAFGGEFSSQTYEPDHGEALWRRSMYVYWKRGMPYPTLSTFDAPIRETCTSRRPRTNTPLQALVLLNDPVFAEAARALGARLAREAPDDVSRLVLGFRLVTSRSPEPRELDVLRAALEKQRARFRARPDAARALLGVGEAPVPAEADAPELAAWAAIGNLLLNLDETIHKG